MVELWRETRIQGRLGWKARPLAREDLDSNLVSMGEVEVMVGGCWRELVLRAGWVVPVGACDVRMGDGGSLRRAMY